MDETTSCFLIVRDGGFSKFNRLSTMVFSQNDWQRLFLRGVLSVVRQATESRRGQDEIPRYQGVEGVQQNSGRTRTHTDVTDL
jgi:hypothetical protein